MRSKTRTGCSGLCGFHGESRLESLRHGRTWRGGRNLQKAQQRAVLDGQGRGKGQGLGDGLSGRRKGKLKGFQEGSGSGGHIGGPAFHGRAVTPDTSLKGYKRFGLQGHSQCPGETAIVAHVKSGQSPLTKREVLFARVANKQARELGASESTQTNRTAAGNVNSPHRDFRR